MDKHEIVDNYSIYDGKIFNVAKRLIKVENATTIERDVVLKNPVVNCLVLHEKTRQFLLVKEYRAGVNNEEIGFVAGIVDDNENPACAAIRETVEETGYHPVFLSYLGKTNTSAGFTNEQVYHFYIEVNGESNGQFLDEDEHIDLIYVQFDDLLYKMIEKEEIRGNHAHATYLKAHMKGFV